MNTVTLSKEQWRTVIACLAACSPSGGGSAQYTICRELVRQTGQDEHSAQTMLMMREAANEFNAVEG